MHEYAIVQSFVENLAEALIQRGVHHIAEIRLRCGISLKEDAVRESFKQVAVGTPLEHTELDLEIQPMTVRCTCGSYRAVTGEDVVGSVFVCPICKAVIDVGDTDGIELLAITLTAHHGKPIHPRDDGQTRV